MYNFRVSSKDALEILNAVGIPEISDSFRVSAREHLKVGLSNIIANTIVSSSLMLKYRIKLGCVRQIFTGKSRSKAPVFHIQSLNIYLHSNLLSGMKQKVSHSILFSTLQGVHTSSVIACYGESTIQSKTSQQVLPRYIMELNYKEKKRQNIISLTIPFFPE